MIEAQEWFDNIYKSRSNITKINISNNLLEGALLIRNFPQLEEIDCSNNYLTFLQIKKCCKLKKVNFSNNELTKLYLSSSANLTTVRYGHNQLTNGDNLKFLIKFNPKNLTELAVNNTNLYSKDLSIFSKFTKLEKLDISNNNYLSGSLSPLQSLKNLKVLLFDDTNLNTDIENLPANLEKICCNEPEILGILAPYKIGLTNSFYDYQE
jgi:Leucine-rich repeat (LRR) protein